MKSRVRNLITAGLASLSLSCSDAGKIIGPNTPQSTKPPVQQNRAPVINSFPPLVCNEHSNYKYEIQATDQDGDILSYSAESPSWLFVAYNVLSGTCPKVNDDTTFPIKVKVFDGKATTEQIYNLEVRNISNARLLTTEQINNLVSVQESNLVFSQPANFTTGDIIASGINNKAPEGFLREITSVSSDELTLRTIQATLEQSVREATLSYTRSLSPSGIQSFSGLEGISMAPSATSGFNFGISLNNVVLFDRDGDKNTTYDQVIADGSFSFNTEFDFDLKIKNFTLEKLLFQNTTNEVADITVGSNFFGFTTLRNITIAEYNFNPLILGYLPTLIPVPIIVTPKVSVSVGIDASRVNPLSFNVTQESSLTTRIAYDNSWDASAIFSNNFDFNIPSPTGEWGLSVFAGPTLKLPLYGFSGPYVGTSSTLRLAAQNGDWQLFGGLNAFIGVSVDVLSHNITAYAKNVLKYEQLLAQNGEQNTDDTFTDTRDGHSYKIININNQTWMAENLNYNASGSEYYQNNSSFAEVYGRLYDWNASKTACPSSWHLPGYQEWRTLFTSLGGTNLPNTGGKMKATGTVEAGTGRWNSPNTGATNESGFSAQPGGMKENTNYSREGNNAHFWVDTTPYAFTYSLHHDTGYAGSSLAASNPEGLKFSIRCVKN